MRIKTGNKRRKRKNHIHRIAGGYGLAFGGGLGTYIFCETCNKFLGKVIDNYDDN